MLRRVSERALSAGPNLKNGVAVHPMKSRVEQGLEQSLQVTSVSMSSLLNFR